MSRSKVKGKGHQGQKTRCALPSPPAATEWNTLAANNVTQQQTGPFRRCGVISAACVRSMFGKTSLDLFFSSLFVNFDIYGEVVRQLQCLEN